MAGTGVDILGLEAYLKPLKGKAFKDVNRELRQFSKLIANDIRPLVEDGVRRSQAPQAAAMAKTVRVHSDRVPVLVVGMVNPRFASGFRRGSAADSRRRRGLLAAGVVKGPKGPVNYYRIPRSESWGPLGRALRDNGRIMGEAEQAYLRFYMATLRRYGLR